MNKQARFTQRDTAPQRKEQVSDSAHVEKRLRDVVLSREARRRRVIVRGSIYPEFRRRRQSRGRLRGRGRGSVTAGSSAEVFWRDGCSCLRFEVQHSEHRGGTSRRAARDKNRAFASVSTLQTLPPLVTLRA